MNEERPLAPEELEQEAKRIFPLSMSPEEYAARHGADWVCFSFDNYGFHDEQLDAWIQQLGKIFSTPGLLKQYQERFLTPEELARVRKREMEDF